MTKTLKTVLKTTKPKEQKGDETNGSRPTHDLNVKTTQFGGRQVNYRIAALWDNQDYINFSFPKLVIITDEDDNTPTLYAEVKHYGQPARIELARFKKQGDQKGIFEGNFNELVAFKRKSFEDKSNKAALQPKP